MKSTRSLALLACCALIPLLNFPRALVSSRALFLRDINTVWSPQIESVVRQVANGEPPFFDGRRGFGQPLFADPRAEVLYPPAWIHWILPPDRSYALFCGVHLILGALGAALLARRLAPGIPAAGEAIAAFAYGAGGPMLSLVSHWHHLAAAAWMPWILAECAPKTPGSRIRLAPLAGLVALQGLAGSPDYMALTLLLCGLRLATLQGATLRSTLDALLGGGLGVLLCAAQLLPSLAFARDAARDPLPIGFALSPLHPLLSLETLAPVRVVNWPLTPGAAESLFGGMQVWMLSHYLGFSVWALALVGVSRLGGAERRLAMGAVGLGLALSWGVRDGSLQMWISHLPIVSGLRFPTKFLAGASLGLAMMAAAVTLPGEVPRRERSLRSALALVAGTMGSLAGLWLWSTGGGSAPSGRIVFFALGPIAGTLVALLVAPARSRPLLLPLLVAMDLLGSQKELNPTTPATLFRERPPISGFLPTGSRLYVSDYSIQPGKASVRPPSGVPYALARTPEGYSVAEGVALAAAWYLEPPIAGRFGYDGSFDLDILDFYRAPLKRSVLDFVTSRDSGHVLDRLRRGSVDFVVTMDPPDLWRGLVPLAEENRFFADTVRIYRVPGAWPRVRFETSENELDTDAGAPVVIERTDGRVRVDALAARATNLVVAMANDRGWRATVDGAAARIDDNDLAFVRVGLPPGRHRVELRYRPPFLDVGLAVSALALSAVIFLARRRAA